MNDKGKYSVGQLSKLSGVSVRTLHFYDEKNVLKAKRDNNGYRFYSNYDAALLQQIIVYRQMDMPLDEIASIIQADDFDLLSVLQKQHQLLTKRRNDTEKMIERIEVSMKIARGEANLDVLFEGLPSAKVKKWKSDIKEHETGEKVLEVYGKISDDDIHALKHVADEWTERYLKVTHLPVNDKKVQELMEEAYVMMNRMYYQSVDNFEGLNYALLKACNEEGRQDEVVVDIYETYQQGMAEHYFDAMDYFAEHYLKGNEDKYALLK
uniref:MerR family transcriptional regulator n=1 Tax=Ningiella ruwaisensis TaxID=2364274 RepID=UPI0010A02FB4|nr:MerR family transcriptional regulator [Ningiella ruwaisensis]